MFVNPVHALEHVSKTMPNISQSISHICPTFSEPWSNWCEDINDSPVRLEYTREPLSDTREDAYNGIPLLELHSNIDLLACISWKFRP